MKTFPRIVVAVMFAVFCAFSIGYFLGSRAEKKAWVATARFENGMGQLAYSYPHHDGAVAIRLPRPVNAPPDIKLSK